MNSFPSTDQVNRKGGYDARLAEHFLGKPADIGFGRAAVFG